MATSQTEVERASNPSVGQELLNVPMGDMIKEMAFAIADAQFGLDEQAINVAAMMSGAVFHPYEDSEELVAARLAVKEAAARLTALRKASPPVDADVASAKTDLDEKKAAVTELNEQQDKAREGTSHAIKGTRDASKAGWYEDTRIQFGYKFSLDDAGHPVQEPAWVSMMELGFAPNFYQFVDTIIEVKIVVSITKSKETGVSASSYKSDSSASSSAGYSARSRGGGVFNRSASRSAWASSGSKTNVAVSSVNGSYSNKFAFDASGSSLLRTKLKAIPSPTIFEDRVRQIMRLNAAYAAYTMKMDAIDLIEKLPAVTEADRDEEARRALAANVKPKQLTLREAEETDSEFKARKNMLEQEATADFAADCSEP